MLRFGLLAACASAAPADCHDVAAARQMNLGSTVRLCSVTVTCTADLVESAALHDFFVQDDSGGVRVLGSAQTISSLLAQTGLGHTIELTGVTGMQDGMFELYEPLVLIDHGFTGVPAPVHTIGIDWQDGSGSAESMEAEFAWIARVQFQESGTFEGLRDYHASDDGGAMWITVRISTSDQNLVGMEIPAGLVNLRGMFGQIDPLPPFAEGYQLLLRDRADILPYLAGDANFDCVVDLADLAQLLAHFGMTSAAAAADGDVDGDFDVDLSDLALLLANFGGLCR